MDNESNESSDKYDIANLNMKLSNKEKNSIRYLNKQSKKLRNLHRENNDFMNMSLKEVVKEWSNTMLLIFTELVNFIAGINKYSGYFDDIDETGQWFKGIYRIFHEIIIILTKKKRILYLGITLIFISFALYLIQITS